MNVLRMLLIGTLGVVIGLVALIMVACQALVLTGALAISRLAELFGRRTRLKTETHASARVGGRTIEGEYTVDDERDHDRRGD